jgi:hypothetical protein
MRIYMRSVSSLLPLNFIRNQTGLSTSFSQVFDVTLDRMRNCKRALAWLHTGTIAVAASLIRIHVLMLYAFRLAMHDCLRRPQCCCSRAQHLIPNVVFPMVVFRPHPSGQSLCCRSACLRHGSQARSMLQQLVRAVAGAAKQIVQLEVW